MHLPRFVDSTTSIHRPSLPSRAFLPASHHTPTTTPPHHTPLQTHLFLPGAASRVPRPPSLPHEKKEKKSLTSVAAMTETPRSPNTSSLITNCYWLSRTIVNVRSAFGIA